MLRLRVRDSSGRSHTISLEQHATFVQLKASVQQLTGVDIASQHLLIGFPPRPLKCASDEQAVTACGVCTGDTLTLTSGSSSGAGVKAPLPHPPPPPPPPPPASVHSPAMRVAVMSDDNSCLFHAISHCLSGRSRDGRWSAVRVPAAAEMRQLVAASILSLSDASDSSPAAVSASSSAVRAYLASLPSVPSYAAGMVRSDTWGGGMECAVLSDAFGCRIHAVDVESGVLYEFGSSGTGTHTCYLLFSGVHYDALYYEAGTGAGAEAADGRPVTMHAEDDAAARDAALAAGAAARASNRYTSLSAFTLRCLECGLAVRGEQEARKHCAETRHVRFDEYKP